METHIVKSWAEVPYIGIQIHKFDKAENAFAYAKKEYAPFGYNVAYYSKDIKVLFIGKSGK